MDGAIIPTSVGVNPTAVISILAERCCRLLAEDSGTVTLTSRGGSKFESGNA